MSSSVSTIPRQGVNARQAETVQKLLEATDADLREHGCDAVTVRSVARRAGVSSATAYTYFASKGHLFAELFLRYLSEGEHPDLSGDTTERVQRVVRGIIEHLGAFPALADAVTPVLLGTDPDVTRLRQQIGAEFVGRLQEAADAEPPVLQALTYAFLGGLLSAGMQMLSYPELSSEMNEVVAAILRGN